MAAPLDDGDVWVISDIPTNASGMPRPSARAGFRQAPRSAGNETCMPSVNSTANSARSAVIATIGLSAMTWISPNAPSPTSAPATRKSLRADRARNPTSPFAAAVPRGGVRRTVADAAPS